MTQGFPELFTELLHPEEIGNLINFDGDKAGGVHPTLYRGPDNRDKNLFEKQIDGTTRLYNILVNSPVAYLADEVGMGKTYQALGIICLVYVMKPDARIAIITPRQNVQSKWVDDYRGFIRDHYVSFDDRVKDALLGRPLHPPMFANNLWAFASNVLRSPHGLHILRLTSFQRPVVVKKDDKTVPDVVARLRGRFLRRGYNPPIGFRCHYNQTSVTDPDSSGDEMVRQWFAAAFYKMLPQFDLVVIDEAQNLRNRNNLRNTNLTRIFGLVPPNEKEENSYIKDVNWLATKGRVRKLLLMSATPAHRATSDIDAQLSYIVPHSKEENLPPFDNDACREKYLMSIMVRRLRRFGDLTKYGYRREGLIPCAPRDIYDHLTIALVQKCQERLLANSQNRFKIGFLSSFESSAPSQTSDVEKTHDSDSEGNPAPDDTFLVKIKKNLNKFVKQNHHNILSEKDVEDLPHPKQDQVVEYTLNAILAENPEKVLIFVRRLASVKELVRRMGRAYDDKLAEWISEVLDDKNLGGIEAVKFLLDKLERKPVDERINETDTETQTCDDEEERAKADGTDDEESPGDDDPYEKSYILSKFADKKSNTRAGKFRNQFTSGRPLSTVFAENVCRTVFRVMGLLDYDLIINNLFSNPEKKEGLLDKIQDFYQVNHTVENDTKHLYELVHLGFLTYLLESESRPINKFVEVFRRAGDFTAPGHVQRNTGRKPLAENRIRQALLHMSFWDLLHGQAAGNIKEALPFLEETEQALRDESALEETWIKRSVVMQWTSKCLRMSESIVLLAISRTQADEVDLKGTVAERVSRKFVALLEGGGTLARRTLKRLSRLSAKDAHSPLLKVLTRGEDLDINDLNSNNWSDLNNQQPIVGVVGGSGGRDRLAIQFKTPFFPDALVCTSVLAEGVDLHLFCQNVMHFGLSYTTGEMEQRVGRIDRYFSKTHRSIVNSKNGQLMIQYPYLPDSIDEIQLDRVLDAKKQIEPLMDKGVAVATNSAEVAVTSAPVGEDRLNSLFTYNGLKNEISTCVFAETVFPEGPINPQIKHSPQKGRSHLNHLQDLLDELQIKFVVDSDDATVVNDGQRGIERRLAEISIRIVNNTEDRNMPHLQRLEEQGISSDNIRNQTVSLTLEFDPANRRHFIEATSAIGGISMWEEVNDRLGFIYDRFPGVRICYEPNKSRNRLWVEGTVSLGIGEDGDNVEGLTSSEELQDLIERVAIAADSLEPEDAEDFNEIRTIDDSTEY